MTGAVDFRPVAPDHPDAIACVDRYFAELRERFPEGFDPAASAAPTLDDFAPPKGCFLVGYGDSIPVACGGSKIIAPATAYLKRMWVDPDARGWGLGRALLAALEAEAAAAGLTRAVLDTHQSLTEAQSLYLKSGYLPIDPVVDEPYADHWYARSLA